MGALVEDMREVWEQSVDELDTSVSLEADGVNDTVAANRFGVRDVADLAEQLTMLVPARVPAEIPDELGKPIPYLRLACRGLLFAVPGLFYLVVARANPDTSAPYAMVIAMLTGWGLSQAVGVVAYRVLGRAGDPSAALILRRIVTGALARRGAGAGDSDCPATVVAGQPGHRADPLRAGRDRPAVLQRRPTVGAGAAARRAGQRRLPGAAAGADRGRAGRGHGDRGGRAARRPGTAPISALPAGRRPGGRTCPICWRARRSCWKAC